MSQPISRVLSRIIIHLDFASPQNSSNLPWSSQDWLKDLYLVLLQTGFTMPYTVTWYAVRSYHTFSPLPYIRRFIFCCTFRRFTSPRSYLASRPMEPGLSSQYLSDYLADSMQLYIQKTCLRRFSFNLNLIDSISFLF